MTSADSRRMPPFRHRRPRALQPVLAGLFIAISVLPGCSTAAGTAVPLGAQTTDPPPVTVLVVVDQLRADLLDRYDAVFTGGFRRLADQGWRFTQTTHDHALTLTAPGHATLVTGTFPSRHGVISNAWVDDGPRGRRMVENVVDPEVPILDDPSIAGASPAVLERSTLGEWLQEAYSEAKVLSVSGKDRAAVLMAGRAEATALWFDPRFGRFVSSTAYMDAYPDWINGFNDDLMPGLAGNGRWELAVPENFHPLARPDEAVWEGDGVHTVFPHTFEEASVTYGEDFWSWWAATPELDRATRLALQAGIEAMDIGTDDVPDLVAVSFSQTDRVGHSYGPLSLEQLDNLYRLDRELDALLNWLDRRFGQDGYLVALSADHGVADTPEYSTSVGRPAFRITTDSALVLQNTINEIAGRVGTDPAVLAPALAAGVSAISWIERGWTFSELLAAEAAVSSDSLTVLQARSTYPGRLTGALGGQGIEMLYSPWTLSWSFPRGTTHGTPWLYDRHVPFILYGSGVTAGSDDAPASTADVAPTLAERMGIPAPRDLDGVVRRIR